MQLQLDSLQYFAWVLCMCVSGGHGSGVPESKILEKPDPDLESLCHFGSSRSLRGHFLKKNKGKPRLHRW